MIRLRQGWPYLFVVAAPLVLFAPFLLGQRVLYWGAVLFQFYPWRELAVQALRAGHLPLWDPLVGNGAPLLANYQSAVLYPPNWLALILPLEYALAWLAALHLAWAGAGMVRLAQTLGFTRLGQVVAGLAFGLSQYLVARVGFFSINAAAAWLPWLIWAVERQLALGEKPAPAARSRLRSALLLAFFTGLLLLAGHAQLAWYSLLVTGAWALWRLARGGLPFKAKAQTVLWLLGPLGLGLLLAAAQLLPTAEFLRESPRALSAGFDFVMTYSFSPWRLLSLLAPDVLGNPARGQFFGYGNYWEDAIYIGVLPLLLALSAAVSSLLALARRRPAAASPGRLPGLPMFLLCVLAASLLLALGGNTPVFPFFYSFVPTFNLFQAPARIMLAFVFALALLAGLGASRWQSPRGRALYWTRLGAAGALAMTAVSLLAWLTLAPGTDLALRLQTLARAFALAGALLFAAALFSLLRPIDGGRAWSAGAALLVCADLIVAGYGLNPGAPSDLYQQPSATIAAIGAALGGHRLLYFPAGEDALKYGAYLSFKEFGPPSDAYAMRDSLLPNTAVLAGLPSSGNFDPLVSARYAGLMQVISETHSLPLLRLMDVGIVASPTPLDLEEIAASADGRARFYRVPGEPRRVWQVASAQTVPDSQSALAALSAPAFDPASTVILEAADASSQPGRALGPLSPAAVTLPVSFQKAGWLVLSDTSYPGWVAAVDGQPAAVLHADYAFRAVAVPAGAHTVVFDYQPMSLRLGLWLSGFGLAVAALLGLAAWRWPVGPSSS